MSFRTAACLAAALAAAACGHHPDDAGMVPIFDQVVFGSGNLDTPLGTVYRWERPVRVAARGKRKAGSMAGLERVLAEISGAAPLAIALTPTPQDAAADIIVFFEDGEAYLDYLSRRGARVNESRRAAIAAGYCRSITWTVGHEIDEAALFVGGGGTPAEAAKRLRQCLYHELAHAVGLAYHPSDAFSILNHESVTARFTRIDRVLLALLYSGSVSSGMKRADALRAAAKILPNLPRPKE